MGVLPLGRTGEGTGEGNWGRLGREAGEAEWEGNWGRESYKIGGMGKLGEETGEGELMQNGELGLVERGRRRRKTELGTGRVGGEN